MKHPDLYEIRPTRDNEIQIRCLRCAWRHTTDNQFAFPTLAAIMGAAETHGRMRHDDTADAAVVSPTLTEAEVAIMRHNLSNIVRDAETPYYDFDMREAVVGVATMIDRILVNFPTADERPEPTPEPLPATVAALEADLMSDNTNADSLDGIVGKLRNLGDDLAARKAAYGRRTFTDDEQRERAQDRDDAYSATGETFGTGS